MYPTVYLYLLCSQLCLFSSFFFFNDTATTEIYTLSLHDALPIWSSAPWRWRARYLRTRSAALPSPTRSPANRSEEHTSELQSLAYLVCRLLLEKKKKKIQRYKYDIAQYNRTPYQDKQIKQRRDVD